MNNPCPSSTGSEWTTHLRLLALLQVPSLYLSLDAYCKYWGISRTRAEQMLQQGELSEKNGALARGSGQRFAHKKVYRFSNPFELRISVPPIESIGSEGGSGGIGILEE